jgi:hypothetical protein
MALTVGNLFKESVKYHMKLLAGENGLSNLVQWVHLIETCEGAQFLHGNEMVITECILARDEDTLLSFVETLYRLNASALIVNTGMFIDSIPAAVISFCNENNFPIFSIPWEVPLVDVTREYCQRIMDSDVKAESVATVTKNLIFHIGEKDALIRQMERLGYLPTCTMTILCISLDIETGTEKFVNESQKLKLLAESTAKSINDQYISFEYQERRIVILIDYSEKNLELYLDRFFKKLSAQKLLPGIYIGVGDAIKGLENQDENFMRAYTSCEIAAKQKKHVLRYQDLGMYKLLANVENTTVLTEFYKDTFGKLIEYDNENGTDLHKFIKTYIESNGHQGDVSEKLFIHRNTANNYVKKVEEIMNLDLMSWKDKASLYAAFCIESML